MGSDLAISDLDIRTWERGRYLWLASRRSKSTMDAYASALRLLEAFARKPAQEIGREDVLLWIGELRAAGKSPSTINAYLSGCASYYEFMTEELGLLRGMNPARGKTMRAKINPYGKSRYLPAEQARALLEAIDRSTIQGKRDYALFLLLLATGRRISEALSLRWGDLSPEGEGSIVYYRWVGKGEKSGRAELPGQVFEAIQAYLMASGRWLAIDDQTAVFTALTDRARRLPRVAEDWRPGKAPMRQGLVSRLLRRYAKLAGIQRAEALRVHMLRHTAAMLRREAGVGIEDLQEFLGHSSAAVTQVYIHQVESRRDVSWGTVAEMLGIG